ncbi:MAG TPA: selenium metabolism-associated LysR family transcriptional regulator [Dissulfurispiraceae bacterium]|nr:selenium metabolism-associated LysR family transcriptional regulator [Dissulfurispiraceae bacterium]
MDIHQLRVFVSVFKNRSFSRASEQLHLTQPTISDHIRSLEQEFRCSLFDRLGRSIIPTREAEVLYPHAVDVIERAEAIRGVIGQFQAEPSGELVVGASTIPGTYLLPVVMAGFRKKFPSISFQIIIGDSRSVIDGLISHELLIGVVGTKPASRQIHFTAFHDDELLLVAAPDTGIKQGLTVQELLKCPMVMREEGSGTRREFERLLATKDVSFGDLNISGIFSTTDAVKQAVKAGLGLAVLSRLAVREELDRGVLKEIRLSGLRMRRQFFLLTHQKRTLPAAYALFYNHLVTASKTAR